MLLFVGWIVAVFALPNFEAPDQSRVTNVVRNQDFRAVIMRGDNLRYYMRRQEFENFPYPDRPALMKEMASEWCKKADQTYLPSVYVYDI
jgi:hypothetical protein